VQLNRVLAGDPAGGAFLRRSLRLRIQLERKTPFTIPFLLDSFSSCSRSLLGPLQVPGYRDVDPRGDRWGGSSHATLNKNTGAKGRQKAAKCRFACKFL